MQQVIIPTIRNRAPITLAQDIVGVQPMTEYSGILKTTVVHSERQYKQGEVRHSFLDGWQVYYGNEWIGVDLWWKLKIKGF